MCENYSTNADTKCIECFLSLTNPNQFTYIFTPSIWTKTKGKFHTLKWKSIFINILENNILFTQLRLYAIYWFQSKHLGLNANLLNKDSAYRYVWEVRCIRKKYPQKKLRMKRYAFSALFDIFTEFGQIWPSIICSVFRLFNFLWKWNRCSVFERTV